MHLCKTTLSPKIWVRQATALAVVFLKLFAYIELAVSWALKQCLNMRLQINLLING